MVVAAPPLPMFGNRRSVASLVTCTALGGKVVTHRWFAGVVMTVAALIAPALAVPAAHADSAPQVSVGNATGVRPATGTSNLTFAITLGYPSNNPVVVNYQTGDSSARAGIDYTAEVGSVTFAPGVVTQNVSVPIYATTLAVPTRTFYLNLTSAWNASISQNSGVGTIYSTTPAPYLNIGDASVTQGSGGTTTAVFTVALSAADANPVRFTYATSDGSARAGLDYKATSGTATISPGQLSTTLSVPVISVNAFSNTKLFYMSIAGAVNASIGNASGEGLIFYNTHEAYVTVDDLALTRPTSGNATAKVAVRLLAPVNYPVTVNYATGDGTATSAGNDYVPSFGTLTFAAGVTSQTVSVTVPANGATGNRYFQITLGSPSAGATVERTTGYVTVASASTYSQLAVADAGLVAPTSGKAAMTFTVSLQSASSSTVTVNYATSDGSAVAGTEYTATNGTLTFTPGQTSQTVAVSVLSAPTVHTDTYMTLSLSAASGGVTLDRSTGYGEIVASGVDPAVSFTSTALVRPSSGTAVATIQVSLSSPSVNTVTVNYATSDGSATVAHGDYSAASGVVTFAPGQVSKTISVTANGTTLAGGTLYFYVYGSAPTNAVLATGQSTIYLENSAVSPTLAVSSPSVYAATVGAATEKFTVTLGGGSVNTVTVNYATSDGSAVAGRDYTSTSGALTFPPGTTSQTVSVPVTPTTLAQANRYFYLSLTSPTNAVIMTSSGVGTIIYDNLLPYVSIVSSAAVRPSTGSVNEPFTIALSQPSLNTVSVHYATSDGSATTSQGNYTATSGTVTFTPGQTSQTVNVPIAGTTLTTGDLYYYVNLQSPVNAQLSSQTSAVGRILDTNGLPGLTVADVSIARPTSGTAPVTFTVRLEPASANTVTVPYSTSDGSAVAGTNYTATNGTLTFTPGQTSQNVTVTALGSSAHLSDLYFNLNLGSPTNAFRIRSTAYGELVNTVAPVTSPSYLTVSDAAVAASSSGATSEQFTVQLQPAAKSTVTAYYSTSDGNAIAGIDYTSTRGTVTFTAGQTSATVTVPVSQVSAASATRYMNLSLSGNTGPSSILRNYGYGYIINDLPDAWLAVGQDVATIKGDSGTTTVPFTVSLYPPQSVPVQVNYQTNDGSALAGLNYEPVSGTLTFAPGQTQMTVPVTVNSTLAIVGTQYFSLSLSSPVGATVNSSTADAFIYNADVFTLSGKVLDGTGAGVAGVNVTRSGNAQPTVTATTAADGSYSFPNTIDGQYTLTPTKTGTAVLPATASVNVRGANLTVPTFLGYVTPGIAGLVIDSTGKPVAGVLVTRTGGGAATATSTSNALGYYSFSSVAPGAGYVLTPTASGKAFSPATYTITMTTANLGTEDIVAVTATYITGRVATSAGVGVANVVLTRSGGGQPSVTVKTNSQGYYGFSAVTSTVAGLTYTITPTNATHTFTPAALNATVSTTVNATGVNFTQN